MNLRALAKEYADGVLGIHAYRKARDELIESILTGNTKLTAHDFQPPVNVQRAEADPDITSIQTGPRKQPASRPGPSGTPDRIDTREHTITVHRGLLIGFVVIIIFLVIVVALYPFLQQKKSAAIDISQDTTSTTTATLNAGEQLIKDFLSQNDWTDENLQQFANAWKELSAKEKDTGLSSSARTELANAIYMKLQEERLMLGIGDAKHSIEKQNLLVTFAHQVGIYEPRLMVQEAP
jgi:hypothetical protein